MCFRNLPIELDAQGHARLKPGVADPYSYMQGGLLQIKVDRERFEELFEGCDSLRRIDVGRMTSLAGGMVVDLPALLELVDRGCAPELAVRIVSPLEWEPWTDESPSDGKHV